MNSSLCHSFQSLAAQTWARLEEADQIGLRWSEETNTETILVELSRHHPADVVIRSFGKHEEALNGADWEWWIGSPGCWTGMRVQAKRINLRNETFKGLQRYKPRSAALPQIENLIQAARADRLIPAYCLYVCSRRWPRLAFWPNATTGGFPLSPSGCLVGHAQAIRAIRSEALSGLAVALLPWHLLVCGCAADSSGIGKRAHDVLTASVRHSELKPDSGELLLFEPRQSLPDYLQLLADAPAANGTQAIMEAANAFERQIAGVVIVRAPR